MKHKGNVTAILTGDWHLREDVPICRTDNFWETQWKKVDYISDLQKEYNCPVWHSGDLYNKWNPSLYLVAETIKHLPNQFYTAFGNHDLPQHNLELANKCGINLLAEAGKLTILGETHWNKEPTIGTWRMPNTDTLVSIWHVMTYTGKEPYPGCTDPKANALLRKYPQFKLIHTGHNHKTFIAELDGRLLVNAGSIMRQSADQEDFEPCVFLYYAESNTVEAVYLPIEEGVVSREHIEKLEQRDSRIEAFISRLNTDWEGGISFEENLDRLLKENKIKESIRIIAYKAIE